MISPTKKVAATNKCDSIVGHFDGHADKAVRCRGHCPTKHVQGYLRCHWTVCPLSPRWTPWSSILVKKLSCGIVKLLFEASIQKKQNGSSTQLIEATSCVEKLNATIKAEEHS